MRTILPATQGLIESIATIILLAVFSAGCGSDDDGVDGAATASPAASPQTQTASPTPFAPPTVTSGDLPSGFPDNFPLYENATPISGSESRTGIVVSLDTPDAFDGVADFYESALDTSPWALTETQRTEGQEAVLFSFGNDDDGLAGTVSVVRPADEGRTLIVINVRPV